MTISTAQWLARPILAAAERCPWPPAALVHTVGWAVLAGYVWASLRLLHTWPGGGIRWCLAGSLATIVALCVGRYTPNPFGQAAAPAATLVAAGAVLGTPGVAAVNAGVAVQCAAIAVVTAASHTVRRWRGTGGAHAA